MQSVFWSGHKIEFGVIEKLDGAVLAMGEFKYLSNGWTLLVMPSAH
jgi:hypothetical protein